MDSDCREIRTSPEAVVRLLQQGKLGEHMDASVKAAGIAEPMVPFEVCPVHGLIMHGHVARAAQKGDARKYAIEWERVFGSSL